MSSEWPEVRLADLCDSIDYGYTNSASEVPVGPRFLRITDIVGGYIDWHDVPYCPADLQTIDKYRLYQGDIVIARTGATTGFSAYISTPPEAIFASYLIRIRVGKSANPRFIAFFLKSPDFWAYIRGVLGDKSAQPNASAKTLTQVRLRLPPLSEQRAIAHILGTLDDKIELNRRMNDTLEAMARAIFKSWFVDFDPVQAKMQGRQPVGMDAETAALFPYSFEASELGEIPREWSSVPLPEIVEINPSRPLRAGKVAPYLEMQNMPTRGHRPVDWIARPFTSGARFQNGDTLLARITPCLENGKTCLVDFLDDGVVGWGSTEYIVFCPKELLPPEYAYLLCRSESLRSHAIQNMTGSSGRQRVPTECFGSYLVAVPPAPILKRFGSLVSLCMRQIKANDEQSRTLAAIRDTLVSKLISGQIRVKYGEKVVEGVV